MSRREYLRDMHEKHVENMCFKQYISVAYADYLSFCLDTKKKAERLEDWLNAELKV